jgi:hypothetical protein
MADVTSTARLIVTVEGEDKVRKLAASLKALGAAGGTKRFGVGTGAGGLAAQMAGHQRRRQKITRPRRCCPSRHRQIDAADRRPASNAGQDGGAPGRRTGRRPPLLPEKCPS